MLESGQKFEKIKDITAFFGTTFATQGYSYDFAIYKAIKSKKTTFSKTKTKQTELKKYIFIIQVASIGYSSKLLRQVNCRNHSKTKKEAIFARGVIGKRLDCKSTITPVIKRLLAG